jgi:transcriptional regulator with XRE-family HTH domain
MDSKGRPNRDGRSRGVSLDGKQLRHYRKLRGLTQDKLGRLAGCRSRTISNAEAGRSVSASLLAALASALRVDAAALLPPEEERRRSSDELIDRANFLIETIRQESERFVALYPKKYRERVVAGERASVAKRELFRESHKRIDCNSDCRGFAAAVDFWLPKYHRKFENWLESAQRAYADFQELVHKATLSAPSNFTTVEDDVERVRRNMLGEVKKLRQSLTAALRRSRTKDRRSR